MGGSHSLVLFFCVDIDSNRFSDRFLIFIYWSNIHFPMLTALISGLSLVQFLRDCKNTVLRQFIKGVIERTTLKKNFELDNKICSLKDR